MLPTYTLKLDLIFDEELVKDFLIAVSDAVNGIEKRVIKSKTKFYKHRKYFTIVVKVKFEDGTKMKFKNKYDFDVEGGIIELTQDQIAKALGQQLPQLQSEQGQAKENKIGFQLD